MPKPKISALVSTYNSERWIESRLQNLLAQTIAEEIEIIVIDSGSQQQERSIVQKFQAGYSNIVYLRTERESLYSAWNRALRLAQGDFLVSANTDDRTDPTALEKLATVLERRADIGLVFADNFVTKDAEDLHSYPATPFKPTWKTLCFGDYSHTKLILQCVCGPQPMWRRSLHEQYGDFDSSYVVSGDYEFWLRIAEGVKFFHLHEPLGLALDNPAGIFNSNPEHARSENMRLRLRFAGGAGI